MLYFSHGLGEAFCDYGDYFNGHQDGDAIAYLTLANRLIHQVNKNAITIAEEVSGMPGLAAKFEDGGYGFGLNSDTAFVTCRAIVSDNNGVIDPSVWNKIIRAKWQKVSYGKVVIDLNQAGCLSISF